MTNISNVSHQFNLYKISDEKDRMLYVKGELPHPKGDGLLNHRQPHSY